MLTRRAFAVAGLALAALPAIAAPLPDMPAEACDCHVHIIGPPDRYPMLANRAYTPPSNSVAERGAFHERLGITRTVLIQPSFYGTNNRAMLDAMHELGDTVRGIAVLDMDVADAELQRLDRAGVRGIRINIESSGNAYVKLSAPYRISKQPDFADVLPIARALIAAGPERTVWASDWPHTDRTPGAPPTTISPFRVVDDAAVLALLGAWCPEPAHRRFILSETPARLNRFS